MRSLTAWMSLTSLLLVSVTGCPIESSITETNPVEPNHAVLPSLGCRVERLDDAIEAVRQLSGADAYVFPCDGDLATCKFEILYKPDETSEEQVVYSATGDAVPVRIRRRGIWEVQENHHLLAIQVPQYPPKPDDDIVFCFAVQGEAKDGLKAGHKIRDSKKAKEIFPDSLMAYDGAQWSSGGSERQYQVKPGQQLVIVDCEFHGREQAGSGNEVTAKRHIVRYRATVTCLEDGKVSPPIGQKQGK